MASDTPNWTPFIEWARVFSELPNFEAEARTNRGRGVARMADARKRLMDGEFWLDTMARSFRNSDNDLVLSKTYTPFLDWVSKHERSAGELFRMLWASDPAGPYAATIDAFWGALPDTVVKVDANRINLVSYALAALDNKQAVVYQEAPVEMAFALTGADMPVDASLGTKYDAVIAFLDEFTAQAVEAKIEVRDRLDAFALMWAVTAWPLRPEEISEEKWEELQAYRGPQVKARKTAAKKATTPRAKAPSKVKAPKPTRAPRGICPLDASEEEVRALGSDGNGRWKFICDDHTPPYEFTMAGVIV